MTIGDSLIERVSIKLIDSTEEDWIQELREPTGAGGNVTFSVPVHPASTVCP